MEQLAHVTRMVLDAEFLLDHPGDHGRRPKCRCPNRKPPDRCPEYLQAVAVAFSSAPVAGPTGSSDIRPVGSGASQRQLRQKLLEAARRREIEVVLVWRLDRGGRSVADLLATLQELAHLGVGFFSLTEALAPATPADRAMAGLLAVFAEFAARRPPRARAIRLGAGPTQRPALGPADRRWTPRHTHTEATSSRRQQSRDRPPLADWPHLGAPYSGIGFPSRNRARRYPTQAYRKDTKVPKVVATVKIVPLLSFAASQTYGSSIGTSRGRGR
jgi:Resolvase, N terminal domain